MPLKMCSHSQTQMIRQCERKWFMHYGMKAKINSRDPFLKEIAFLKKIKPSYMWRGELIHGVISDILKSINRPLISIKRALQLLGTRAKNQWDESLERASTLHPKSSLNPAAPILMEHYYTELDEGLELGKLLESMTLQITNFYTWMEQWSIINELAEASNIWIEPTVYLPTSPGFFVDEVRFVTKVDLAFLSANTFKIFDWKTGIEPKGEFRLSSEYRQASFYGLWPHLEMNHPLENIDIGIVYVGGDKPKAFKVKLLPHDVDELLTDAELLVRSSNEFLDVDNSFGLEDFDWATFPKACMSCQFQQICRRELR